MPVYNNGADDPSIVFPMFEIRGKHVPAELLFCKKYRPSKRAGLNAHRSSDTIISVVPFESPIFTPWAKANIFSWKVLIQKNLLLATYFARFHSLNFSSNVSYFRLKNKKNRWRYSRALKLPRCH